MSLQPAKIYTIKRWPVASLKAGDLTFFRYLPNLLPEKPFGILSGGFLAEPGKSPMWIPAGAAVIVEL